MVRAVVVVRAEEDVAAPVVHAAAAAAFLEEAFEDRGRRWEEEVAIISMAAEE